MGKTLVVEYTAVPAFLYVLYYKLVFDLYEVKISIKNDVHSFGICYNRNDSQDWKGEKMDYKKLSKKAQGCMYVKTAITILIELVCLVVFLMAASVTELTLPKPICIAIYVLIAVLLIYAVVAPKLRYERYRYLLTEEEFAVRRGFLILTTEIVPIERLHKIEVSAGPVFRAFHLKEIKVTTAGGEIKVSYLDEEVADKISQHLKKRINAIAVEQRLMETTGDDHGEE